MATPLIIVNTYLVVASLGVVSPGAVTDGVALFLSSKKLTTLFWSSSSKWMTFFGNRHHSHPLPAFQLIVFPVLLVNSAEFIFTFVRVSPPGWCHSGWSTPSDATGTGQLRGWMSVKCSGGLFGAVSEKNLQEECPAPWLTHIHTQKAFGRLYY